MTMLRLNSDVEIIRHPDGAIPIQIIGTDLLPEVRATDAARSMTAHIGRRTLPKYLRGSAALMSAHSQLLNANPHTPELWDEAPLVSTMWSDVIKGLGYEPKWNANEGCYYLSVPDDQFDRVNVALNGAFTLYEAARDRNLYDDRNPLECLKRIARAGRRTARSLFRIKRDKPRTLRTQMPAIVERIRRAGRDATRRWPASVTMLVDLMIEGLSRLSEQIALTLKDWWDGSEFGERINTPNKGDDYARTKVQAFSAGYCARLKLYVDTERVDSVELAGGERRTLDDFRKLALAGDLKALEREALFTNAKGGFFSASGVGDYYLRSAFDEAGLPHVTSHAIRHAGVNAFFAWLKLQEKTPGEKAEMKLFFGRYMGWKWPEAMLDHYSEPERRDQATTVAINFLQARREQLKAFEDVVDLIEADEVDHEAVVAHNDADLDRLAALEAA